MLQPDSLSLPPHARLGQLHPPGVDLNRFPAPKVQGLKPRYSEEERSCSPALSESWVLLFQKTLLQQ